MALKECPSCLELIQDGAAKCPHCRSTLEPGTVRIVVTLGLLLLLLAFCEAKPDKPSATETIIAADRACEAQTGEKCDAP